MFLIYKPHFVPNFYSLFIHLSDLNMKFKSIAKKSQLKHEMKCFSVE